GVPPGLHHPGRRRAPDGGEWPGADEGRPRPDARREPGHPRRARRRGTGAKGSAVTHPVHDADVLIDRVRITARIEEMAREIRQAIPEGDVHFVCVLKGAFMFLSDLVRAMDGDVTLDFI